MTPQTVFFVACLAGLGALAQHYRRRALEAEKRKLELLRLYAASRVSAALVRNDRDRYKRLATQVRAAEVMDEASARLRIVN